MELVTELDERKRKILKAIIQTYLETGEPVGLALHYNEC